MAERLELADDGAFNFVKTLFGIGPRKLSWEPLMSARAARYGYRVTEIPVAHRERAWGESRYGPGRLFRGLADLLALLSRKPSLP